MRLHTSRKVKNIRRPSDNIRKYRPDAEKRDSILTKVSYKRIVYDSDLFSKSRHFKSLNCVSYTRSMYTPEELHDNVIRLHKYCLTHLLDSYRVHLNRLKGVRVLDELLRRAYFDDLKISQIVRIIWSGVSIVHHFHIRQRVGSGFTVWTRRRQARHANTTFDNLMELLLPDLFTTVIHSIVTFFEEAKLWNTDILCSDLLQRILNVSKEHVKCLNVLLDIVEQSHPSVSNKVLRVIYNILEDWACIELDDDLVYRLLVLYKDSLLPEDSQDITYTNKGLEVCLRKLFKNVRIEDLFTILDVMIEWALKEEFSDEALLYYGNVLECAAMQYKTTKAYNHCLSDYIISNLLALVSSDNMLKSLLGHRVFQQIIDRHGNKRTFDVPRIFFQNTHFNINLGIYSRDDRAFVQKYGENIHSAILFSIQKHGVHRINLECVYCSIAVLVIEVPCGYTAASMACLVMAIQETTLANDGMDLSCSNRIHAVVMSIMSLICWIHKAEIFYEYLNTLLQRRATCAPHLNPPVQMIYEYARDHVLWNKPELFFEDWEVRYGLWKCFRQNNYVRSSLKSVKAISSQVAETSKEKFKWKSLRNVFLTRFGL